MAKNGKEYSNPLSTIVSYSLKHMIQIKITEFIFLAPILIIIILHSLCRSKQSS